MQAGTLADRGPGMAQLLSERFVRALWRVPGYRVPG